MKRPDPDSPPGNRERPGQTPGALSTSLEGDTASLPSNPLGELSLGRRTWARRYIERQTPARPTYGTTRWLMLDDDHPDKLAAAIVAAECWASAGDTLEDDLRREIAYLRAAHKREEDGDYQRSAESHRVQFGRTRFVRSFMDRRADQLAAAKPRPGDHAGGPAQWSGGDSA